MIVFDQPIIAGVDDRLASLPCSGAARSGNLLSMAENNSSNGTTAAATLSEKRDGALPALAGGLAHDLNNVLSAVLMMTDLLEGSCTGERERAVLTAMTDLAQRGVALGRQMLWLARGVESEATLFQPKHLLGDLQRAARAIFPPAVTIASEISPQLFMLRGDPLRVYRLLLDLCLATRDTLAAGGELTLAARNETLDEVAAAQRPGLAAGPHVVLEIARSAGGGLFPAAPATVVAAVQACGGFAEAVPKAGGQGFRVVLPATLAGDIGAEPPPTMTAAGSDEGKGEMILVAEGADAVREAMAGVLERHGYQVRTAGDGAEAVALFARDDPPFSAVVAAADLSYLGGAGVLRAARRLRDGVPGVLTSGPAGPAADAASPEFIPPVPLAKPFTAAALLAAVRRALDG